jgi:microcystin-dependent protein
MSVIENRPPRTTPNLGLPVPGDAGPADAPTVIGDLADVLDTLADRIRFAPGDLKFSASPNPGNGWLPCDGRLVGRTNYPELFDAIGTTYSGGDGVNTFGLPDYRDRVLVGASGGKPLNTRGGAESHTLSGEEMPYHAHGASGWQDSHNHGFSGWTDGNYPFGGWNAPNTSGTSGNPNTRPGSVADQWVPYINAGWSLSQGHHNHSFSGGTDWRQPAVGVAISPAGASWAHNNMQPYAAANVFIKT